jgi:hypothetical protein
MTFTDTITKILSSAARPVTPQEIREVIKKDHPQFYGTQPHIRNVEKGHYKDIDHALLAQIYTAVRTHKNFFCDSYSKPMKISLRTSEPTKRPEGAELRRQKQSRLSPPVSAAQFEEKIRDILANSEKYHEAYYKAETFRGPSLYFHQRALETRQSPGSLTHLEYVYATLASWGMHRMGKGGSKMQSFDVFRRSIETLQSQLVEAQRFDFREMNDHKWTLLKEIFQRLNVMASGTSLVGNSKVMHHMLPNVVPPIDREYTLWYLLGNKNIRNDLDWEWELMKEIIANFFIPVASDREFELMAKGWIARNDEYPWDTSFLKIVDNLVIGAKK